MQRFFENKLAFVAIFVLFATAVAFNASQGNESPAAANKWRTSPVTQLAHGPSIPPDPWDGLAANHGPSIPPDPWDGNSKVQHGPSIPPDPWDGLAANHGPSIPPDPWDGNSKVQHGPSIPPDPWDGLAANHGPIGRA
jgi:hypothetical protein